MPQEIQYKQIPSNSKNNAKDEEEDEDEILHIQAAMFNRTNDGSITIVQSTNNMTSDSSANRQFLYFVACASNLAAFTCGISFGWTSPEIPLLKSSRNNPLPSPLTASEESWIGSLLPVGAIIGPFIAGHLADKIGRKNTLLIGVIPFIIGFLLAAFATSSCVFFLVRFLFGLGVGAIFTVLPMYIGEISDDKVRGSLGSFMQLFITFGLLFSYVLGPYTSVKLFNLTCAIIPVFSLLVFYLLIPESPYYLIKINDKSSAELALMKLRFKPKSQISKELNDIKASVEAALANEANFMDIFKSRGLTKALIISVGLVSLQQFSGINIVLFYAQSIFTDAGSTLKPEIATIIIGIVQIVASAATPALVEKKGKCFLLLLSAIGMGISQSVLAYYFYLKYSGNDVSNLSWMPVTSLILYIMTYCLGFGPLPWAVMGELFPGNIKSVSSTATASICWFLAFILTKYYSIVSGLIGISGSFAIFAVCCFGAIVFIWKFVPETTGKSLQEIQDILSGTPKR